MPRKVSPESSHTYQLKVRLLFNYFYSVFPQEHKFQEGKDSVMFMTLLPAHSRCSPRKSLGMNAWLEKAQRVPNPVQGWWPQKTSRRKHCVSTMLLPTFPIPWLPPNSVGSHSFVKKQLSVKGNQLGKAHSACRAKTWAWISQVRNPHMASLHWPRRPCERELIPEDRSSSQHQHPPPHHHLLHHHHFYSS